MCIPHVDVQVSISNLKAHVDAPPPGPASPPR